MMPDAPDPAYERALATLDEEIARTELQVTLLYSVMGMRIAAGRDCTRLQSSVRKTKRRLAELKAQRQHLAPKC